MYFPSLSARCFTPHLTRSREPDYEDDETRAGIRKIQSLSVAVELESLIAVSTRQLDLKVVLIDITTCLGSRLTRPFQKPVTVGAKVPLNNMSLAGPLPPLLVIEEARRTVRRVKDRGLQANGSFAASPHEPRLSCIVLPVISDPNRTGMSVKKRRQRVRERPSPAYWRPSPDLQGKCIGYALGYPSSWAPDRPYVRDAMKRGFETTSTCHAVRDNAQSE